jgi:hypothetical protein
VLLLDAEVLSSFSGTGYAAEEVRLAGIVDGEPLARRMLQGEGLDARTQTVAGDKSLRIESIPVTTLSARDDLESVRQIPDIIGGKLAALSGDPHHRKVKRGAQWLVWEDSQTLQDRVVNTVPSAALASSTRPG